MTDSTTYILVGVCILALLYMHQHVNANSRYPFESEKVLGVQQGMQQDFEYMPFEAESQVTKHLKRNSFDKLNESVPPYEPGKVKEPLKPEDLLPQDKNSVWAQVNPEGTGSLAFKNFLEAGYHIGIDTIGSSKRNANHQLRPDIPNPKLEVGPWQNTVIDQDYNISKPLL